MLISFGPVFISRLVGVGELFWYSLLSFCIGVGIVQLTENDSFMVMDWKQVSILSQFNRFWYAFFFFFWHPNHIPDLLSSIFLFPPKFFKIVNRFLQQMVLCTT